MGSYRCTLASVQQLVMEQSVAAKRADSDRLVTHSDTQEVVATISSIISEAQEGSLARDCGEQREAKPKTFKQLLIERQQGEASSSAAIASLVHCLREGIDTEQALYDEQHRKPLQTLDQETVQHVFAALMAQVALGTGGGAQVCGAASRSACIAGVMRQVSVAAEQHCMQQREAGFAAVPAFLPYPTRPEGPEDPGGPEGPDPEGLEFGRSVEEQRLCSSA